MENIHGKEGKAEDETKSNSSCALKVKCRAMMTPTEMSS